MTTAVNLFTRGIRVTRGLRDTNWAALIMRQNITIAIERGLLRKARVLAAERGTSVSRLLADELARLVGEAERYDQARSEALADLDRGLKLGGRPASRDALHDR